jgi:hypothetical protein
MEEETPRPSIDIDSPRGDKDERHKQFKKLLTKYGKVDYCKAYHVLRKFRNRQRVLLETDDISDPDPFAPTYIFYCFTGNRKD